MFILIFCIIGVIFSITGIFLVKEKDMPFWTLICVWFITAILITWFSLSNTAASPNTITECKISWTENKDIQYIVSNGQFINVTVMFGRVFPDNTIIIHKVYRGGSTFGIHHILIGNDEFIIKEKENASSK